MNSLPHAHVPQRSGYALAALLLGLAGLSILPVFASIGALITGYAARRDIDRSGGALSGRGMALWGIVLGWVGIVLTLLTVLVMLLYVAPGASAAAPSGG